MLIKLYNEIFNTFQSTTLALKKTVGIVLQIHKKMFNIVDYNFMILQILLFT